MSASSGAISLLTWLLLTGLVTQGAVAVQAAPPQAPPRIGVLGMHGGVYPILERAAAQLPLELHSLDGDLARKTTPDLSHDALLLVQHLRVEDLPLFSGWCSAALREHPDFSVLDLSGRLGTLLPGLQSSGTLWTDPDLTAYYHAAGEENLRRMLQALLVRRFGLPGEIPPLVPPDDAVLYHPEHDGPFATPADYRRWTAARGFADRPLAVVTAHRIHRLEQQPRLVDALVSALEQQGLRAVVLEDNGAAAPDSLAELSPDVVVHTCHSFDDVDSRLALDVPHLHSIFFRRQSIDEWKHSPMGLPAGDVAFQIASQELLGAIEPQIGAGTLRGGNSPEDLTPLPERVQHLARRAAAWARLRRLPNSEKKIALIYYNREMGKGDLMRGSATGMSLNAPRSMVTVLKALDEQGYSLPDRPRDEDQLMQRLLDHGQQIGVWNPSELDALARSGHALLLPEDTYRRWLDDKLTPAMRQDLEAHWGPAPGRFGVWQDDNDQRFLVIPRVDLGGGVILLPQPLRGEAYDSSLVHDTRVPPSHNYLATYFWLQEGFGADALVHFGTHGTEFLLPGRGAGLGPDDWSDLIMGSMPNITLWAMHNLGESAPARRRAYAVLVDHLVPPSMKARLPDELSNLQSDMLHLGSVEPGPLADGFLRSLSAGVKAAHLDDDLHLQWAQNQLLSPDQVSAVDAWLRELAEESAPTRLHLLGQPPRDDERVPWVTLCLGGALPDALDPWLDERGHWKKDTRTNPLADGADHDATLGPTQASTSQRPDPERMNLLEQRAAELVQLTLRQELSPAQALAVATGAGEDLEVPETLSDLLATARQIDAGLMRTGDELSHLLAALSGRFVPPGPGNSPDRNPAAVPTGRNMVTLNPREVPSRPSWELGRRLLDELLSRRLAEQGHYPERIGFDLSSFATFRDYGVMEAQILHALGVEPVWDGRRQVHEVRLVPTEQLGRPRIDVMIASGPYYRDILPGRMKLLDKAVRLVADLDEPDNLVFAHSRTENEQLLASGMQPERARILSRARLFGYPPGQLGSASYYYLVEKSGDWDDSDELARIYTEHSSNVYTEGLWGEAAPEAYRASLQGTEVVLRTWSDRTLSPLSNKYMWYRGGSLCLAVTHVTGVQPDFLLTDVRDPSRTGMLSAEEALTRDFRVRLLNRDWARGMLREGYAGADQVAKAVSNVMGWSIMRPDSVSARQFEDIVQAWVRDGWQLGVRDWFEAENPFAYQELTEILLESIRKGYWDASPAMRRELAGEFADSVARHGEGGGLLGGGNQGLQRFVEGILESEQDPASRASLTAWKERREQAAPGTGTQRAAADQTGTIQGVRLEPSPTEPLEQAPANLDHWGLWAALAALGLVGLGFLRGRGRAAR